MSMVQKIGRWTVEGRFNRGGLYATEVGTVSRTRQEFAAECDINTIMKKYAASGVISHINKAAPRYYDFSDVPADFQAAMNMMIEADGAFMRLPSDVRKRFGNDPAEFVQFAGEKDNLPQMREWGLAAPEKPQEAPMRVEVVNPTVPPPAAP